MRSVSYDASALSSNSSTLTATRTCCALYDEYVPVLLLDGVELAHAPLSEQALRSAAEADEAPAVNERPFSQAVCSRYA